MAGHFMKLSRIHIEAAGRDISTLIATGLSQPVEKALKFVGTIMIKFLTACARVLRASPVPDIQSANTSLLLYASTTPSLVGR